MRFLQNKMFGNVCYVLGIVVAIGVGMHQYTCGNVDERLGSAGKCTQALKLLDCDKAICGTFWHKVDGDDFYGCETNFVADGFCKSDIEGCGTSMPTFTGCKDDCE